MTYLRGDGVESDLDEGKRWLGRAAAKGDDQAADLLEGLRETPGLVLTGLNAQPVVFGPRDHK